MSNTINTFSSTFGGTASKPAKADGSVTSVSVLQEAEWENRSHEIMKAENFENLERELAGLKEELESEREQRLRLLAEFDNYRRRTRQDSAEASQAEKREVLLEMLDLLDDFDRALLHIDETSDEVANGVRLIHQRFNKLLEAQGVTAFESEGELFDPTVHEAMTAIEGDGERSGTVYSEYRRGYLMNGKLLRPARVAVLK